MSCMFFKKHELEEFNFNLNGNISEQVEELSPRSNNDSNQLYTEIWDNMTTKLYMDEVGQVWKRIYFNDNLFEYVAKCNV